MQIAVLGTGSVGQTLSAALSQLGHEVVVGSRQAPPATFADAAAFGELVINCTSGMHSLAALRMAGAEALAGKVLIDVANPLDFSDGFPPRLAVAPGDSLGAQLQREFPDTRVVKALNTVTASVMVQPRLLAEPTDLLIAGDDADAKAQVVSLLAEFGWSHDRVRDLGGIEQAKLAESYLPLWLALMAVTGTPEFNIRIVGVDSPS